MRKICVTAALSLALLFLSLLPAQAVEKSYLKAEAVINPGGPDITLSWDTQVAGYDISIYRRLLGEEGPDWGSVIGTVTYPDNSYVDTAVTPGNVYEYKIYRPYFSSTVVETAAHVVSGIEVPAVEDRGKIVLVVDNTLTSSLEEELVRLEADLAGDGWTVIRHDSPRNGSGTAEDLKAWIVAKYGEDTANTNALLLFGRLPIVMSGYAQPDGHDNVPHATDLFYADMDGTWTDSTMNYAGVNEPGDGIYDQNYIPGDRFVEMEVGRVDLAGMTAWPETEVELLRNYLRKDHAWRNVHVADPQTAHYSSGYLQVAWGGLFSLLDDSDLTGPTAWIPNAEGIPYTWGADFSDYNGSRYPAYDFRMTFTLNFGSHKQKWHNNNNPMRAMLCMPQYVLTCGWGARPNWFMHHMSMGQTIGYSAFRTQNNYFNDYIPACAYWFEGAVHVNLMGDPTLRMNMVKPASNLTASLDVTDVDLAWTASSDGTVLGYNVYRADSMQGPFVKLNGSLIPGTAFTDSTSRSGDVYYMVRAYKLVESATGSYYDLSQGIFVNVEYSGVINNPPVADDQNVNATDGDPVAITVTGSDPDAGDVLTLAITKFPDHGTLSGEAPDVTYTPDVNYSGPDSIQFSVWDGLCEDIGTVSLTVADINHIPTGQDQFTIVHSDITSVIRVTTSDQDGDAVAYDIVSQPANGTAAGGADLAITPDPGFKGGDSFTWRPFDGTDYGAAVTQTVTVVPVTLSASDNFDDGDFSGWSIDAGIDNWSAVSGELEYSDDGGPNILKWDSGGSYDWTSHAFSVKLRSTDDDTISALFHYQDASNYYSFEMNRQSSYMRLYQLVAGARTNLVSLPTQYVNSVDYELEVFIFEGQIFVQMDDVVLMQVADPASVGSGTFALHNQDNKNSYYDNVEVWNILTVPTVTLTYIAGANGSISGTTPQTVVSGGEGTPVAAVPDGGYYFVDWSDASTDNPRTDTGVTADLTVTANFAVNSAPTVATAASASADPVTGNTVDLSVLGSDTEDPETSLIYTWNTTAGPAAVNYSEDGNNAAKNTEVTFFQAGSYTFEVTIEDTGGMTVTDTVSLTVNQTLSVIDVSPSSAEVITNDSRLFTASPKDQFGDAAAATVTWSVSGGGSIDTGGLFTAGSAAGGPYTVTAENGVISGTASVSVVEPDIVLKGNGVVISDGDATPSLADHTDFGTALVAGGTVDRTFQVENNGGFELVLNGTPLVELSGPDAADFTVTADPSTPVAPSGSTVFTVRFDPSAGGLRTAVITVDSDDPDTPNYAFSIQGTGDTGTDTDGDGMPDSWEIENNLDEFTDDSGLDPDGDNLTNLEEYTNNTDPNSSDTDSDLYSDGWEIDNGYDPLDPDSHPPAKKSRGCSFNGEGDVQPGAFLLMFSILAAGFIGRKFRI